MSRVPTIPDFDETVPQSIGAAVRTLKQAMEIIGGLRQGEALGSPLVFVQANQPMVAQENSLRRGDLWIDDSVNKLNFWSGTNWVRML